MNENLVFTDGTLLSDANALYIMLAEDDLDDQEFFSEAFSQLTSIIKIYIVNNGNKATQVLNNLPADKMPLLIILDYNLPELNGAEVLERLNQKAHLKTVPKLVWSTSDSPVFRQRSMENGAHSYIVKPTSVAEIKKLAAIMLGLCTAGKETGI